MDIGTGISSLISVLANKALSPTSRLHWIYLLSALALAIVAYRISRGQGERRSLRRFLFPREVWLHPSAVTDYLYVAMMVPAWSLWVAPHIISAHQVSQNVAPVLQQWLPPLAPGTLSSAALALLYTVVLVTVTDLERYWAHRLMHRVPALWEFHKVHHSAEALTPITFFRAHPIDMLLPELGDVIVAGTVTAVFLCLFPHGLSLVTILGVNAFRFAFYLFGANLRHSHIWLSFGPTVERFLISPAQHQIHHSAEARHFDRNFGSEFAVWDYLFGTLYLTRQRETLTLGLGTEENRRFKSAWQILVNPFRALIGTGRRHRAVQS